MITTVSYHDPRWDLKIIFSGRPSEDSAYFLNQYTDMANACLWCATARLYRFKFYLVDGALDWYARLNKLTLTWPNLIHQFRQAFPDSHTSEIAILAFDRKQKTNEDLMTYFHNKMRLFDESVAHVHCTDEEKATSLIEGMNETDRRAAAILILKSTNDVYKFILSKYRYTRRTHCYLTDNTKSSQTDDSSVERVFALVSSNTERPTAHGCNVKCFRCKQNGHKASLCRRMFEVT